ncbi:hypothetical protein AB6A40_008999 [Gnathostoma spinigerum]|uniref:EGF-like domain-containing protein n=1 Tax=Gnathostoma spinigerum TaxID=75299 RepID=A0ABD6F0R1_9BILA
MSLSSVPVAVLIFYVIKAFELPLAEELGILDKEEERKSDTCLHGGHRADATCFCSPNWAGKRCETPRCQNEGLISGSNCLCPEGFTGRFCQTPICSQKNVDDRSDSGKRTFAIVLEKTKANKRAIHSVADNIREIMEGVTRGNHTWFERYVLLRITSKR